MPLNEALCVSDTMNFIPKNKSDLVACEYLSRTSAAEVTPYISELLEWLQDANWPVAGPIAKKLVSIGADVEEPIVSILKGSDEIWKYWVISLVLVPLVPSLSEDTINAVKNLANNPTLSEIEDEVNLVAKELIESYV